MDLCILYILHPTFTNLSLYFELQYLLGGLSWHIKVTHVECTTGQELKIIITVLIDNFILKSFIVFSVQIYQLMDSLIRSEKNETPFLVWSMGSKMSFFRIFMIFFFP